MAHLVRVALAALLLSVSFAAQALVPQVSGFSTGSTNSSGVSGNPAYGVFPTAMGACQAYANRIASDVFAGQGASATAVSAEPFPPVDKGCVFTLTRSGDPQTHTFTGRLYAGGAACPVNSTQVSGGCQCNAGYVEDPTQTSCILKPDDCLSLAGKSAGIKNWHGTSDNFSFCDGWNDLGGGKCVATGSKDISWEDPPGSGKWISQGRATYTGNRATTCNGDGGTGSSPANSTPTPDKEPPNNPPPGEAAPTPCPPGQAPGSVNGSTICAPRGSDVPAEGKESTTTKHPDGSTTRTDTSTRCDGTKCATDTRVCKAAPGGLETCETTTKEQAQTGFCEKSGNKDDKLCQGQGEGPPSSFGGTCQTGFKAVSEDAVVNAMAQEQHKRNCEMLRTDTEPSTWAEGEGQKTGNAMDGSPHNGEVSIGAGNFDTSDALGGGGCNLNKTVTVRGFAVALPFNVLCDPLAVLGQILVAVSLLLAARIVTRG